MGKREGLPAPTQALPARRRAPKASTHPLAGALVVLINGIRRHACLVVGKPSADRTLARTVPALVAPPHPALFICCAKGTWAYRGVVEAALCARRSKLCLSGSCNVPGRLPFCCSWQKARDPNVVLPDGGGGRRRRRWGRGAGDVHGGPPCCGAHLLEILETRI